MTPKNKTNWKMAMCVGEPIETFYPQRSQRIFAQPAIDICNSCPIKAECLEWALEHDEQGIWGGTTLYERNKINASRRRPKRRYTTTRTSARREESRSPQD